MDHLVGAAYSTPAKPKHADHAGLALPPWAGLTMVDVHQALGERHVVRLVSATLGAGEERPSRNSRT
jgi:hypothetical protein